MSGHAWYIFDFDDPAGKAVAAACASQSGLGSGSPRKWRGPWFSNPGVLSQSSTWTRATKCWPSSRFLLNGFSNCQQCIGNSVGLKFGKVSTANGAAFPDMALFDALCWHGWPRGSCTSKSGTENSGNSGNSNGCKSSNGHSDLERAKGRFATTRSKLGTSCFFFLLNLFPFVFPFP